MVLKNELSDVLKSLGLTAIYWVDDDNVKTADMDVDKLLQEVSNNIFKQGPNSIKNAKGKMPVPWRAELGKIQKNLEDDGKKEFDQRPDRSSQIETKLRELSEGSDDSKRDLGLLLESLDGKLSNAEKAALTSLFRPLALDVGYVWKTLSFSDWESQQGEILSLHTAAEPALILLDQQNTKDKSSLNGNVILKTVCSTDKGRAAFKFLVVTNTCVPADELEHAVELAKSVELGPLGIRSPLFTMSKSRITRDGKDGEPSQLESHFVSLLRRLRLSLLNQDLTALARDVIQKATDRAFNRLTEITLHEFMYAVTQSSQIEGVSELDTLLRLVAIEQRDAMLNEVVKNKKLRTAIESIRAMPVHIREKEINKLDDLTKLRSREVYWPAQAVNKLHQPIAAGDIFKVKIGKELNYYVLLGNDCDLMMRSNGDRNSVVALLAKLANGAGDKDTDVQLECPLPQDSKLQRVPLNRFLSAPAEVLDLCWLNQSGACVWDRDADYEALRLLKSQDARRKNLAKLFANERAFNRLVASSPFPIAPVPFTAKKVDFRLQRVGRMNAPYAQGLLAKFAGVFARPSYDHNYSDVREPDDAPVSQTVAPEKKKASKTKDVAPAKLAQKT